jgi:hypothetical protein
MLIASRSTEVLVKQTLPFHCCLQNNYSIQLLLLLMLPMYCCLCLRWCHLHTKLCTDLVITEPVIIFTHIKKLLTIKSHAQLSKNCSATNSNSMLLKAVAKMNLEAAVVLDPFVNYLGASS